MIFLLILIFYLLQVSFAIEGLIWSKPDQNFVPLFSISSFSIVKNDSLEKIREFEYHNFNKAILHMAYYQETNLISFMNNNTKVSGVCGEMWNLLADYLNFTLIPIKIETRNFGNRLKNGTYDGVLGTIQRNQSQIIPRTGVLSKHLSLLEYTLPIWTTRYHLYIIPEWKHDEVWMFHLFKTEVWYSILFMLLTLSLAGFICNKFSKTPKNEMHSDLQDYILYSIGIATNQGWIPMSLQQKSGIIYICTSIFCWLILIGFNSNAIFLMMNKKSVLPFTGLKSLIQKSKYEVIAFNGSMVHELFANKISSYLKYTRDADRILYADSAHKLYEKVCFSGRKLAGFEAEDRHKAIGKGVCRLIRTHNSYFETWIASAVKRGFQYKRSFDIGILKISETGLLDGLKDRWLDWKITENESVPFQSIDISQVYLIFSILLFGLIASILILLIEYLTYFRYEIFKFFSQLYKVHLHIVAKNKTMKNIKNQMLLPSK